MIRFGLCCLFKKEPIVFRRTTAAFLARFSKDEQLSRLSRLCLYNAQSLMKALEYCSKNSIKSFRINSQILPLKTHPDAGYHIKELPDADSVVAAFKACGDFCRRYDLRTTFHPDQFILLSSPSRQVTGRSRDDLSYQAEVAGWVHADVMTIHPGGVYGDKKEALRRLRRRVDRLPDAVRSLLALENDDRSYTPRDIIPLCREMHIPFVYDVHHHRCLPDGLAEEAVTGQALMTWNREPLFHLSSPLNGWEKGNPRPHHDYINMQDFPSFWKTLDATIEVEAKAKELAVKKMIRAFSQNKCKQKL